MDDCNSDALKTLNPTKRVQIPLWTIVTRPGLAARPGYHRSDSSMDDCNDHTAPDIGTDQAGSDSSMDDCNGAGP